MEPIPPADDSKFTLIELLVVVAIIAILASLLLPALSRARASAKSLDCLNKTKQLALGMEMYAEENDDFYTPLLTSEPRQPSGLWNYYWTAKLAIGGYLGETAPDLQVTPGVDKESLARWFGCPIRDDRISKISYSKTCYGLNTVAISNWNTKEVSARTNQIIKPSDTFVMVENRATVSVSGVVYPAEDDIGDFRSGPATASAPIAYNVGHPNATNVTYADGHVESMAYSTLINYCFLGVNDASSPFVNK